MKPSSIHHWIAVVFLFSLLLSACGNTSTPTTAPVVPVTGGGTATLVPSSATEPPVMPTSTSTPPAATHAPQETTNELVGEYRVKLPPSPPDISAGYYRMVLYEDGTYTIAWSPLEAQTGAEGASGTYTVDGDQIVFTDKEGFAACNSEEGVTGTYKWSLSSQGLSLIPIDDTCAGRVYILSTKPFPPDH